jgi:hypothetical protein
MQKLLTRELHQRIVNTNHVWAIQSPMQFLKLDWQKERGYFRKGEAESSRGCIKKRTAYLHKGNLNLPVY